jgi:hypothetical protein
MIAASYREIADELGVDETTVARIVSRWLARVAQETTAGDGETALEALKQGLESRLRDEKKIRIPRRF